MTREEFIDAMLTVKGEKLPCVPTGEEYLVIEQVYNFHPAISETQGKEQIAYLYVEFGMSVIRDMLDRADLMQEKEAELSKAQSAFNAVRDEIASIRRGEVV